MPIPRRRRFRKRSQPYDTTKTLPLFAEDGVKYVQNHISSMYPLLPTMQHVNRTLIRQVLDEMVVLYQKDEIELAQQITWMKLMLERTETIPAAEKRQIQEELRMFDRLVNESPWLKEVRNQSRDMGRAEGRAEGELRMMRRTVMDIVDLRFPTLIDNAQLRVEHTQNTEELRRIGKQLIVAPDEATAIRILNTLSA